jgi:hypothetical protein
MIFHPHITVASDAEDAPNFLITVLDRVVMLVDSVDCGRARRFWFVAILVFRVDFSDEQTIFVFCNCDEIGSLK